MKYKIQNDIRKIQLELADIRALDDLTKMVGWKQVVGAFQKHIGRLLQDVLDKCDEPKKHEFEIKCKKLVADGLADILYGLDARVKSEQFLRQQLASKAAKLAEIEDRQRLAQM